MQKGPRQVVCSADTCRGAPRLARTRLTCADVVVLVRTLGVSGVAKLHHLDSVDVENALLYCSGRQCIGDQRRALAHGEQTHFCAGCSLTSKHASGTESRQGRGPSGSVPPGVPLPELPRGSRDLWLVARELLSKA